MTPYLALALVYVAIGLGQDPALRGMVTAVVFSTTAWSLGGLRDQRVVAVLVAALTVLSGPRRPDPVSAFGGAG